MVGLMVRYLRMIADGEGCRGGCEEGKVFRAEPTAGGPLPYHLPSSIQVR